MASITLKNIPDALLRSLRQRAAAERRSLTQEVIHLLERAIRETPEEPHGLRPDEAESQAAAWERLAGRWRSEISVDEEIDRILAARTTG